MDNNFYFFQMIKLRKQITLFSKGDLWNSAFNKIIFRWTQLVWVTD